MDKDGRKMTDGKEKLVINSNKLIVASSLVGTYFSSPLSYALKTTASPMTTVGQENFRTSSVYPRGCQVMSRQCWHLAGVWGGDPNKYKWLSNPGTFPHPLLPSCS